MPGNFTGGKHASETNKKKYGDDFYAKIGAMGGRVVSGKPKGFAANPELAKSAGRLGGLKSKRGVHMPDGLWQLKQRLHYCKSRVNYYKRKLTDDKNLKTDYQIQQAERGLAYWEKTMNEINKEIKKMEN